MFVCAVCGCATVIFDGYIEYVQTLVVEDEIDCTSVVNWHYFHPKLKNPPVCYLCGSNCISPMSEDEKLEYRTLHKICASCQQKGRKPRGRKKTRVEESDDDSMEDSDFKSCEENSKLSLIQRIDLSYLFSK